MSHKIQNAHKATIGLAPCHRAIALTLSPKLVEGIRHSLELSQGLIDAASNGDQNAIKWLESAGFEVCTTTEGRVILIRK